MYCVYVDLLYFVWCFPNFGDALLCYKVVCKCVIKNGVLARRDVFFW